ncbi:hypothetical protein ASZ78_013890, partial [Callipepla squamata]
FVANIFVLIFVDFLRTAAAQCMVHEIQPRSFMLPCLLLNETSSSPFAAGVVESWSGLRREYGAAETHLPLLMNEESFLCCLWSDNITDCSLYRADMHAGMLIPSEISISAFQKRDSYWNIECWIEGKLDLLVCGLKFHVRLDLKVHLLYAVSELPLADVSTSSLRRTAMAAQCNCSEYGSCECHVPSPRLNHTYIMWLKTGTGLTCFGSPLMSVKPIDIVKPGPPLNVHLEMTEKGQVKICWSEPAPMPYPLHYQVNISGHSAQNGWQVVQVALNTTLDIDDALLESSSFAQVRCRNHYGPGFWSEWSTPYNLNLGGRSWAVTLTSSTLLGYKRFTNFCFVESVCVRTLSVPAPLPYSNCAFLSFFVAEVLYFPSKILTSVGSNVSFHCIYKNKSKSVASEEIDWWLNLAEEIPESQYTLVNDRVSKVTLFNLKATKPRGSFFYNALYCCHQSRECHHRYAELYVVDVNINIKCETDGYLTEMTCRWSANPDMLLLGTSLQLRYHSPAYNRFKEDYLAFLGIKNKGDVGDVVLLQSFYFSLYFPVKPLPPSDIKAEITRTDGLLNVSWTNPVFSSEDLKFQIRYAVSREELTWELYEVLSVPTRSVVIEVQLCVEYVVQMRCRALDGLGYWSNWSRPAYAAVKDIQGRCAFRVCSGGFCSVLALAVNAVQSLIAYPVNSTCVILTWTLLPQIYTITSFTIEWRNLNKEEEMKWVRVPPNISKYYIYDHFILIEKYLFSLYPVFAGGVGKSRATDQFTKGECSFSLPKVGNSDTEYTSAVLTPELTSSFRMKKMLWEDVPNPKHCSWAQGVDFQQPETFEHLFVKHPEAMSFEPLLEPEIVLEDISVTKALKKEDMQDFLVIDSASKMEDSRHGSACPSSQFSSHSFSESSPSDPTTETSQPSIKYAAVIADSGSGGLHEQKNPTGRFAAAPWELGNEAFLLLPEQPGSRPCKTLSLISSEGFSEPSDQDDALTDRGGPERGLCYLGITSLGKRENNIFLTESSRLVCHFRAADLLRGVGFLHDTPPHLNAFVQSSIKAIVPYVPQFQMTAAEVQETAENSC